MQPDSAPVVNSEAPAPDYAAHISSLVAAAVAVAQKPSPKTGEFWKVAIGGIAIPFILALLDKLPAQWAAIITASVGVLAAVIRTRFKGEVVAEMNDFASTLAEHHAALPPPAVALPPSVPPPTAPFTIVQPPATAPAVAAALALFALMLLPGCAGFGAKLAKIQASPVTQAVEKDALKIGLSFLESSLTGQDINAGWGIAAGLNTITDAVKAMPNPQAAELVRDTAVAFAGSKNANVSILATQLANAFGVADPKTPEERTAAVLALASGITAALTQPAK